MTDKEHAAAIREARDKLALAIHLATKAGLEVAAHVETVRAMGHPPEPIIMVELRRPVTL